MHRYYSITLSLAIVVGLTACARVRVDEAYLSTQQRVAVIEVPGNGVTPPATVVMLETQPGKFSTMQPIAAGFAAAPVTAIVSTVGAASATAVGYYAGQKASRGTQVSVVQGGQSQAQTQEQTSEVQAGGAP